MSKRLLIAYALALLASLQGGCILSAQDKHPNHQVVSSTMLGFGGVRLQDTYLSPLDFTGPQFHIMHESLRPTHYAQGRVSVLSTWHADCLYTTGGKSTMLGGDVDYHVGWHYNWLPLPGLRIMAGGKVGATLGGIYNTRNSNNPAQAYAQIGLAASAAAIYRFTLWGQTFTLRDIVDLPLVGASFSPNYGQSYYELFSLGNYDHNICFVHPGNAPSLDNLFTLDFPIKDLTFRIGYLFGMHQQDVNNLKRHAYTHAFMIGWVRHLEFRKRRTAHADGFMM